MTLFADTDVGEIFSMTRQHWRNFVIFFQQLPICTINKIRRESRCDGEL
jgi:hypothetical protein